MKLEEAKERREFDRRLQEAGIKAGIEAGLIEPNFDGGEFQGFRSPANPPMNMQSLLRESQGPLGQDQGELPEGAEITQTIKTPQGTITIKRGGQKAAKSLLPAQQLQQDIRGANETILRNQSLPSSAFIPEARQQLLHQLPETPFVQGSDSGFLTGSSVEADPDQMVPRSQVVSLMAPGVAEQMAPQLRKPMVEQAQGQLQGLLQTRNLVSPPTFREDLKNGIRAVSEGKISRKEAINRLLRAYPDKASTIEKLEQELF